MQQLAARSWVHANCVSHTTSALSYQYTKSEGVAPRRIDIREGQFLSEADWLQMWAGSSGEDDEDDDNEED